MFVFFVVVANLALSGPARPRGKQMLWVYVVLGPVVRASSPRKNRAALRWAADAFVISLFPCLIFFLVSVNVRKINRTQTGLGTPYGYCDLLSGSGPV